MLVEKYPYPSQLARPEANCIKAVVAEDHPRVRAGLVRMLKQGGICVLGEASNGYEAVQLVEQLNPDVLLLDIEMPEMNGLLVTKVLRATRSQVRVLVVSAHAERTMAEELIRQGAAGYVTKEEASRTIVSAVRAVMKDKKPYLSHTIRAMLGPRAGD